MSLFQPFVFLNEGFHAALKLCVFWLQVFLLHLGVHVVSQIVFVLIYFQACCIAKALKIVVGLVQRLVIEQEVF